jgi:hypothetical protein
MTPDFDREISLIAAFVVQRKRERYCGFLDSPKRRPKFLCELYHFRDFDPACLVPLSGPNDSAAGLIADLRRRGAAKDCYVISVVHDLDGVTAPLEQIVPRVFALAEGTLLLCIPGRLAYYEGEAPNNRYILERRTSGPTSGCSGRSATRR